MGMHFLPHVGGPFHMRAMRVHTDGHTPPAFLNYGGVCGADDVTVTYELSRSRVNDRDTPMVYRFTGEDRHSWGDPDHIAELDHRTRRMHGEFSAVLHLASERDRRDRWALLDSDPGRNVTVYRGLPVLHVDVPGDPMLVLRPPFPLWIDDIMWGRAAAGAPRISIGGNPS